MLLILKLVFAIGWTTIFVIQAGPIGLLYGLMMVGFVGGIAQLLFPSLGGSESAPTARAEAQVSREQGELVNARRGNPDPTRPADWTR